MREAQNKGDLSQLLQMGALNRVLSSVAKKQDERYQLLPERLGDAHPDWPLYSSVERSTLSTLQVVRPRPIACA